MLKNKLLLLSIVTLFIMVSCSQNIEKQIVGTWKSINESDDCDTNMEEKITFDDDGMVIGIEGYKTYKIEQTENDEYDYAILSGGYEDTARYRIKFDENDNLNIVYEEEDIYDFDSAIASQMKQINN